MLRIYNEFDAKAAAWLRELIAQGHISPGVVDERSIKDLTEVEQSEANAWNGLPVARRTI